MSGLSGKTLVTGGVRSGKSSFAEGLVLGSSAVVYVATGYPSDASSDPDWAERVARHQQRRPSTWRTIETLDVAAVLQDTHDTVLIDCIGLWVTRTLDAVNAWSRPLDAWVADWEAEVDRLAAAWEGRVAPAVAVTNEVGWGVVPDQRAGRLFADSLGRVNQRLAATSDDVVLMVAGRPLRV